MVGWVQEYAAASCVTVSGPCSSSTDSTRTIAGSSKRWRTDRTSRAAWVTRSLARAVSSSSSTRRLVGHVNQST